MGGILEYILESKSEYNIETTIASDETLEWRMSNLHRLAHLHLALRHRGEWWITRCPAHRLRIRFSRDHR